MKLPLLVAGLGMALWSVAATGNPPPCSLLARVVGPEDFEVDASTTPPRLLVSSQDRRRPDLEGAIFAVDLESGERRRLRLRGRGRCSFHPHGVSLVPAADGLAPRLYVVNHHDPGDGKERGLDRRVRPRDVGPRSGFRPRARSVPASRPLPAGGR